MILILVHVFCLMVSVVLHEISHGVVAFWLGDNTAKNQGRLSLNPLVHLDFFGSFLLPVGSLILGSPVMIGWAKPVPISMGAFKHPYRDMMWVALAGPVSNFLMAAVAVFALHFGGVGWVSDLLVSFIQINIVLGCFNLIPIPPLDGSRLLAFILSWKGRQFLARLEPYGILFVLLLAYLGILNFILGNTAGVILDYLNLGNL